MNSVSVSQPSAIAAFVPAPGRLAAYIEAARQGSNIKPVPADVQQAAWQHLRTTEPLVAAGTKEAMLVWLRKLAPAVVNAPTEPRDIAAKTEAIWEQCCELPAAVWCVETRLSWGRRPNSGKFWPAAGELYEHLAAYANTIQNERAGCERILAIADAKAAAPDAPDPRKDPVEQEAVRALMQAWRQETSDHKRASEAEGKAPRPERALSTLSDHTLLAIHEKQARDGNKISATRAHFLREKLGIRVNADGERVRA